MDASRAACPTWTDRTERAWRQAWLLLSDVLAAESLSPFAGPCSGVAVRRSGTVRRRVRRAGNRQLAVNRVRLSLTVPG